MLSEKIKICIFSGIEISPANSHLNGAAFVNDMLSIILSDEYKVRVICPFDTSWHTYEVSKGKKSHKYIYDNLENTVLQEKIDIAIQCHSWYPEFFEYALSHFQSKCILLLHSIKIESIVIENKLFKDLKLIPNFQDNSKKIIAEQKSIKLADFIITVSESEKNILMNKYNVYSKCIYNPFDISYYPALKENNEILIENKKDIITVGCLGRLDIRKSYHYLIDAIIEIRKKRKDIELYCAGFLEDNIDTMQKRHSSYKDLLKNKIKNADIKYLDSLDKCKVKKFFEQVDIAVIPSSYESFGYCIVEALAFSKKTFIPNSYSGQELSKIFKRGNLIQKLNTNSIILFLEDCLKNKEKIKNECKNNENFPDVLCEKNWKKQWIEIIDNISKNLINFDTKHIVIHNAENNKSFVDITLSEYKELRTEIIQFQNLQSKILLGVVGFFITLGTFLFKFVIDAKINLNNFLFNNHEFIWVAFLLPIFNTIIISGFLSYNITIGKASDYIKKRLKKDIENFKENAFEWESYYSRSKLGVISETLPGILGIITIQLISISILIYLWPLISNNFLMIFTEFSILTVIIITIILFTYWIYYQLLKPHNTQ